MGAPDPRRRTRVSRSAEAEDRRGDRVGEGELCSPEPFAGGAEPFQGSAVIDVLQVARVRILRYLARRGVVHLLPEALEIQDELVERDPVLAQLVAAAVSGLPPAGPELRCRGSVRL